MSIALRPIGVIRSPFLDPNQTPIQAAASKARGLVEINPEFADGLQDIEGFSYLHLLYVFHLSNGYALRVKPFLDDRTRGVFSTRHPCRPNPLGLSVVRLVARRGNVLEIEGLDMLDGTPLLDIKPYVPDFDVRAEAQTGWYASRSRKEISR
jgi:tRNA-Thr(GGU) m(6)t(6)A37 methyltransferase TsaA